MAEALTREDAVRIVLEDASSRFGATSALSSVEDETFPNTALGAALPGEMSAMMMTPGWRISVNAEGSAIVYRASARQVRLVGEHGDIELIHPK